MNRPRLRSAVPFVAAVTVAVLAAAQAVPDRSVAGLMPGDDLGGTVTVLNPGRTRSDVRFEAFVADGGLFHPQSLGGLAPDGLPPGGAARSVYVADPDTPELSLAGIARIEQVTGNTLTIISSGDGTLLTHGSPVPEPFARRALVFPGFEHRADGSVTGSVQLAGFEPVSGNATLTVVDASGAQIVQLTVEVFPFGGVLVTGQDMGLDGVGTLTVLADDPVVGEVLIRRAGGLSVQSPGRVDPEGAQYWYPYFLAGGFDASMQIPSIGPSGVFTGQVTVFDGNGQMPAGGPVPFDARLGATVTLDAATLAGGAGFPGVGAACVDVTSVTPPRAPVLRIGNGSGDFTFVRPMRRIAPGSHGVAPIPDAASPLFAHSVVTLNNPTTLRAEGLVRLRGDDGGILVEKKVKLNAFNNVALPLSVLSKKVTTASYVEVANPAIQKPKGGGTFQASVVFSSAGVGTSPAQGTSATLSVVPLEVQPTSGQPVVVAPRFVRGEDDKKGQLLLDGRAAGVGRSAILRMVPVGGGSSIGEWKVRGAPVIKLKMKSRSKTDKSTLASRWPVGSDRTFVLVDTASGATSEPTVLRRPQSP